MHLNVADAERIDVGRREHFLEYRFLCTNVRTSDALCLRGMICVGSEDDSKYWVVIRNRVFVPFDDKGTNAFRTTVSIGAVIESLTVPCS